MMEKRFKVKDFTLSDVVDKLTACEESVCFLKCWKYWRDSGQQVSQVWFNEQPQATRWAIDNGFVEKVTLVHDWSGLKLIFEGNGSVYLKDTKTGMILMDFFPNSGAVVTVPCATDSGAGNFDSSGRLIITPGE